VTRQAEVTPPQPLAAPELQRLRMMGTDFNRTPQGLRDNVEIPHDSQKNFRQAAERGEAGDLKRMLTDFSAQRARLAREVQVAIQRLGEPEPPDTGTVKGAWRRTLAGLKATLSEDPDRTLLQECEHGEDAVIRNEDALGSGLPRHIHELLEHQLEEIGVSRTYLREIEQNALPEY
jgi:uncharacterized protein (TIGR02284 family)